MELRCESKKHGEMDGEFLEVQCRSRFCGYRPGIVVIHRFDVRTGDLKNTRLFREPPEKLEVNNAT